MGTNNTGNVWSIADALNGGRNQSYGYDALNRITAGSQADGAFNQTFSYDAFGNMRQDGNPITTTGQNLNYNAESQLVSLNNGLVNYSYDASGDRIRKDLPGGAFTEYVYFGGSVIAEKDQAGDWTDYVYANGQRLAKADSFGSISGRLVGAMLACFAVFILYQVWFGEFR